MEGLWNFMEKLRPQDGTVGERIRNNNTSDKVERMQLKKLDEKGEKKGKAV